MLLDQLGGAPSVVTAIPLIVRGKVVAALYADSPSTDSNAMNADALELLTRVASMAVNLVSIQRAAAPSTTDATPATAASPESRTEPEYTPQVEASDAAAAYDAEREDAHVTSGFEHASEAVQFEAAEPHLGAETQPLVAGEVSSPQLSPAQEFAEDAQGSVSPAEPESQSSTASDLKPDVVSAQIWPAESHAPAIDQSTEAAPMPQDAPTEPLVTEAPPPVQPTDPLYTSDYSTPLGSSRRYGVAEPELPVEVSEDERRLHNDARRFARLLVSEIKLYNEPKVREGRTKGDLYDRLRDDIDRSRQMYDKRVAPPVAARHDYFHQELVNTLAEGDVNKLGMSYPGASVSVA
jgi:hypothetical protein